MSTHNSRFFGILSVSVLLAGLSACSHQDASPSAPRFRIMPAAETGVDFANVLTPTSEMNIFNYLYFYNGAGVAVGDVNNDDLPDIYFTSNQQQNKLYLNKGDFQFEDVTEAAGVGGDPGWTTGVTMVDINSDGLLDIYVSQLGEHMKFRGKNQLYVNLGPDENGVPVFENQAELFGLDLIGYATQATFFDYDLDGDLDMFMLNHSVHKNGTFGPRKQYQGTSHERAGDRLLRNDGNHFTDVTAESGILHNALGYGLGVTVSDINLDGYPDIYVGNDFHEDDYLYLNNGEGTFREVGHEAMQHTSRFSMGNDIGDINNDGFPDLVSLDMLPEDPVILKASAAEDAYDVFHMKLNFGYSYQYARNTLQLNIGNLPGDTSGVKFSEIGLLAGMAATDWSWSSLLSDFDNDGRNDLFISNGIWRRSNDMDYINFIVDRQIQARIQEEIIADEDLKLIEVMPQIKVPNYLYQNRGDLSFKDVTREWGLYQETYSNGAAYADFDNDGDLDLVVNNVNEPASLYRNLTAEGDFEGANYLKIKFAGEHPNGLGFGAKVILEGPYGVILREQTATRGFQSAVDTRLNIGLGDKATIEKLTVIWPDFRYQVLTDLPVNQTLTVRQADASGRFDYNQLRQRWPGTPVFTMLDAEAKGVSFKHQENRFVEFNREPLMPHMVSAEGPELAVGDVDGDGLEDFYVGGAKWQAAVLYRQLPGGRFEATAQPLFQQDSLFEDVGAAFFDADGDGDLDLFVGSGGNEWRGTDDHLRPRLYINDGTGVFSRPEGLLPDIFLTASAVAPEDIDGDGDIDVFIGARAVPWQYGVIPASYLLLNDGDGRFQDATASVAPALASAGFVREAIWVDMNGDKRRDLVLACEWSPLRIFLNDGRQLRPLPVEGSGEGWWSTVIAGDFDEDGDMDLIAGNLGLNSKLQASKEEPVTMFYHDFDNNGTAEQLLCYYYQGEKRLFATKDEITGQLISVKKKFVKYREFAEAKLADIFDEELLEASTLFVANEFRSSYIENLGDGAFKLHPLALPAQFSTIGAGLARDFDGDGHLDALLLGNFYETNIQMGRYDASYGLLLKGRGDGSFEMLPAEKSGLLVTGQCRDVRIIDAGKAGKMVAIARNNESIQFLKWNSKEDKDLTLK